MTSQWGSDLANLHALEGRANSRGVPSKVPTLANYLQDSGYGFTRVGLAHNPNLAADWNFDAGFGFYDSEIGMPARKALTRALIALDEMASLKNPFFLFIHFQQTHFPYNTTGKYAEMYTEGRELDYSQKLIIRIMSSHEKIQRRNQVGEQTAAERLEFRDWIINKYDRSVAQMDGAVGVLLDTLRERGLYENALIIFNSDHGEEFGDHGRWGHSHQLYQELLHIPLMIKYPAQLGIAPSVESRPVSNLDILPTILGVLDIEPQGPKLQGADLRLARREDSYQFSERREPSKSNDPDEVCIRGPRYKLIRRIYFDEDGPTSDLAFDLQKDPNEKNALPEGAPEVEHLRKRLDQWLAIHRPDKSLLPIDAVVPDVDEDTLRQLRDLGYLGDE